MKQTRLALSVILLAVLAMSQISFAKEKSGRLGGWYSHYAKELNMTDEQVAKYKQIIAKKQEAESKWKTENEAAYKAAMDKMKAARASDDKAAYKTAHDEMLKARKGKNQAQKEYEESLDGLLTPEQKAKKASIGLAIGTIMSLRKANLTEDQKAKIKAMAEAQGANIAELKGKGRKAVGKARQAFKQKVIDEVLTEEQKAARLDAKLKYEKKKKALKAKKESIDNSETANQGKGKKDKD